MKFVQTDRKELFPEFRSEEQRLRTFHSWSHPFVSKESLAFHGFFSRGYFDFVHCFVCGVELGSWEIYDDVNNEHLKHSDSCSIVQGLFVKNYPIDAKAWKELCDENRYIFLRKQLLLSDQKTIFNENYKEMSNSVHRIDSFINCASEISKDKIAKLVEAGLFFASNLNCVKCFSCLGELPSWRLLEDPMKTHSVYFPECKFIKFVNGVNYIINCISKEPPIKFIRNSYSKNNQLVNYDLPQNLCKICFKAPEEVLFKPCSHKCVCTNCALGVSQCPICSLEFDSLVRDSL